MRKPGENPALSRNGNSILLTMEKPDTLPQLC